jgi:hypothetical protein
VCRTPSSFVQITVVPFEISTISGVKVELLIAILTGAGVVVCGVCVGAGVVVAGCVVVVVVHPLINTAITNSPINNVFFMLTSQDV